MSAPVMQLSRSTLALLPAWCLRQQNFVHSGEGRSTSALRTEVNMGGVRVRGGKEEMAE